jgi:dTDP-4-amino-4,6-dideoxygalactose transaminase
MLIPFNKPHLTGKEFYYMQEAVNAGKLSGDGIFTKKCQAFFERKYGFRKTMLTTSCTDALEMASILIDIKEGDEVIMPSYTFVSTANPFILRGAKIVFVDSRKDNPGIDESLIESLITNKTKAIVIVHYAGIACDMDAITKITERHQLFLIEDAAQAIDSYYKNKPLGSFGHLAAFSFHETKNIISGEGGMLVINDSRFAERAEIIREKGTNRSKFFRGEVDKYNWVDIGSSFLPSDIIAAFLYAQLENIELIQNKRKLLWKTYFDELSAISDQIQLPSIPDFATNNAHMFYIVCKDENQRNALILHLKNENVHSVFHYLSLHKSPFYAEKHGDRVLPLSDFYTDGLIRLPLFFELETSQVESIICKSILSFFDN